MWNGKHPALTNSRKWYSTSEHREESYGSIFYRAGRIGIPHILKEIINFEKKFCFIPQDPRNIELSFSM